MSMKTFADQILAAAQELKLVPASKVPTVPAAASEDAKPVVAVEAQHAKAVTAEVKQEPPVPVVEEAQAKTTPVQETTAPTAPVASAVVALPDLASFPTLSNEEIAGMQNESRQKGQWAQAAAARLLELSAALAKLDEQAAVDPDIILSDYYRAKRQQIESGLAQIQNAGGSEELRARLGFSRLLEEIRATDHHDRKAVLETINNVLVTGRRRLASKEEAAYFDKSNWPAGSIFFGPDACLRRELKNGEQYTAADRALESTFKHFIEAAKKARKAEVKGHIASMKERASVDGKLRGQRGILRGEKGVYYLYSPRRREGDRERFEGHALLEVFDDNKSPKLGPFIKVRVMETEGSLNWLGDKRNGQRTSLPLSWVRTGSIMTRKDHRLKEDDFKRSLAMVRTIRALIYVNDPEPPKPMDPPKQEEAQTQPTPVAEVTSTPVAAENAAPTAEAEAAQAVRAEAEPVAVPAVEAPQEPAAKPKKRAKRGSKQ